MRRPFRTVSASRGLASDHAASRCRTRAARARPCRAAAEAETTTAEDVPDAADAPPPGPIPYAEDTETFQDVFAFSGALPEVRPSDCKPQHAPEAWLWHTCPSSARVSGRLPS